MCLPSAGLDGAAPACVGLHRNADAIARSFEAGVGRPACGRLAQPGGAQCRAGLRVAQDHARLVGRKGDRGSQSLSRCSAVDRYGLTKVRNTRLRFKCRKQAQPLVVCGQQALAVVGLKGAATAAPKPQHVAFQKRSVVQTCGAQAVGQLLIELSKRRIGADKLIGGVDRVGAIGRGLFLRWRHRSKIRLVRKSTKQVENENCCRHLALP